jgi:hypothetical protein
MLRQEYKIEAIEITVLKPLPPYLKSGKRKMY